MHQGTVRRSDPGQEAHPLRQARPVASSLPPGQVEPRPDIARLQQQIAQLERRCEEADSFAHAVAHGLRCPLSAIDGFSSLLEEALQAWSGKQSEQARHLAARLRASAQHMGELIEGLQALSRLSRSPLQSAAVDLSALAEQVLDPLAQQHPRLQRRVQPGLAAQGDRRLLRQLLENLFENACKFSGHSPELMIEFGRQMPAEGAAGQEEVFYVRVHGAGFDMAQADRLFQPYQRLHSSAQFEGLGLGLAIVQRIVNRHGGRVWARSAPGQGATIYFTLGSAISAATHQGG